MSEQKTNISYRPTDGLTYDPNDPKYWDETLLKKEIDRSFEICHGCRMCFKYCDSFPSLFKFLDQEYDGDVHKIKKADTEKIMNACFQCKLCEVNCPYTVREKHEYQLDFPKLVHRYKAIEAKKNGVSFGEKILGNPDLAGQAARASFGMANVMNRVGAHRWFLEKIVGIHRDKLLPEFAQQTFESWAEAEGLMADQSKNEQKAEVVLFQTCYVQNNEPQIGKDTVEVFQKNQINIKCEKGLQCCGMPKWESGDLEGLRKQAKVNLAKLLPHVERGAKIVAINPTCSMMFRREYAELVAKEDQPAARKLAAATCDPSEFLWSIREEPRFNTDFQSSPGDSVGYHAPCHLRTQAIGFKGRDLLRKIPGVVPKTVMECCGHDGTYAMKTEGFEPSVRIGKKSFDGMKAASAEVWSTDCPLAAIQFQQHAGVKPMHPMSILAKAYKKDGFEKKIEKKIEKKDQDQ